MPIQSRAATIPKGSFYSDGVLVAGGQITFVVMPDDWTPAMLSFQVSLDEGATWHDLSHAAPSSDRFYVYEIAAQVRPGAAVKMPPGTGDGISLLRFRSGTATTPVVQQADRVIMVVLEI